jgi:uncharacterized protein YybS (DUF2232 family)
MPPELPPPSEEMADFDLDLLDPTPALSQPSESGSSGSAPVSTLALVETAFLASTTTLIWLIQYYFQLGPFLRIFYAIPIALIFLRWNRRTAWMTCIVATLLLSIFLGPPRGLQFLMPHGFLGIVLGYFWKRQAPWWLSITWGSLLSCCGSFFQLGLLSLMSGDNLWLYFNQQVTNLLNWLMSLVGWMGEVDVISVQIAGVVLYLLTAILYNFTVHLAAWLLFERLGHPIPDPPEWVQVMLEYQD